MSYPHHPLADIFPLIEGDEFQALVASIRICGQRDPIMLHGAMVLDGRNRQRACIAAGVEPRYEDFTGTDALAFVIDKNLRRRHLDESQRAFCAAKLANLAHGGDRKSDEKQAANLPLETEIPDLTQADAARLMNVSERSVRSAKAVQERGTLELQEAVARGALPVSVAEGVARLEPEKQRDIARQAESGDVKGAKAQVKKGAREERERALGGIQAALPTKRYGVILADPEWRFEVYSRETGMDRSADNHYPTSATDAICQRDVKSIAADDCVLFLWATAPMLPDALKVMAAWGFTYKSHIIWQKDKIGTGYWFRNQHELLLVGTRGNVPAPAMGTQWTSVLLGPVTRHSAKPELFLEMIEKYFPTLPKIELNRRGPARPGWDAWGNESEPEAQREDPALTAAPAPSGDEPEASAMSPCTQGDGAVQDRKSVSTAPHIPDGEHPLDIPGFLKRQKAEA